MSNNNETTATKEEQKRKRCWTECERTFYLDDEGDLIYDSYEGTTLERLDEMTRLKVVIDKGMNWKEMANFLFSEVRELSGWMNSLWRQGVRKVSELPVLERPHMVKREVQLHEVDPSLFIYFFDDGNWVMYENDDMYLFLFDLRYDNHYLAIEGEIENLGFTPKDTVTYMTSFLETWYYRVNGDDAE